MTRLSRRLFALVLAAPLAAVGAPALAAEPPRAEEARAAGSEEALGNDVPRGAVQAFFSAARKGHWEEAAKHLDLSALPEGERAEAGPRLAWQLATVLERKLWIDRERLSTEPEGQIEDELPKHVDRLGQIATEKGPIEVRLERLREPDGSPAWKFAGSTVDAIPTLWSEFGYGALGAYLPEWAFTLRFLGIAVWQWAGLVLLVGAAWLLAGLLVRVAQVAARPFVRRSRTSLDDRILELLGPPARLGVALAIFAAGVVALRLPVPVQQFLVGLQKGFAVVVVTWILMRLAHVGTDLLTERLVQEGRTSVAAMVPLGRKALKLVLLVMALVGLLQNVGFNVTGIVAGLGVGGLAVALAAQKTVENLFGGFSLAADRPVRVGDFCRFGDTLGTVEDIGLRSTRIRTLDRTVVTVPNASFSQMELENFAERDKVRLVGVLGLRYETTPDQLRFVLAELRQLFAAHPMIEPEPARVRLIRFGGSSLDVEFFAYVRTTDFNDFCKVREDVLLRIMDVVARSGSSFAFPSQTLYLGRDGGLDAERTEAAERAVQQWRRSGSMPFPDFPESAIAEIDDSLDWPPEGSATAPKPKPGKA